MTDFETRFTDRGVGMLKKVQVNVPFPLLLENLDPILAVGFQPEIYFSGAVLDGLSRNDVEKVSGALRQRKTSVTFHAPFMDLNPGAVDERVREITGFRFHQLLDAAAHFHPRVIVFHPGYDRWRYDGDVDLWLEKSLTTWKPLVERAASLPVKFAVENVFEEHPSSLKRLFDALNSPHVGYCLDAGHAHLFSEVPLKEWIEMLGPHLFETHIHDNHGEADEHLPVGQGSIDFEEIFSAVKAQGLHPVYTIEPHLEEHLEPSLRAMEKYI
jgi:sugar phosphate isomerase/epimerase